MDNKLFILVLTKYNTKGASSRLRSIQYFDFLAHHNIDIDHSPLFNNTYIDDLYNNSVNPIYILKRYIIRLFKLLQSRRYNLIWLEKELFPWLPLPVEKLFPLLGVPYIVDYDDAIFHTYDHHPNKIIQFFLKNKIPNIMKSSTLVTVCNKYLKEKALSFGAQKVEVVPTVVDLNRYKPIKNPSSEKLIIGWSGTPKTEKYLIEIMDVFDELSTITDFKLFIIGGKSFKSSKFEYEIIPWSEENEAKHLSQIDLGIMPLTDSQWEKGKCAYKLILYMANSKPVVASNVGMNAEIVKNGINGFLVKSHKEWISSIRKLNSADRRIQMGHKGRKLIEEKYSLQSTIQDRIDYIIDNASHK